MLLAALAIALGIGLLYGGAEALVRGSSSAAARLGLTPLVIGLTVVAFGTSAPELVVSVDAALAGQGALAVGNVVGSNIGNIGLILGLTALIRPAIVHARIIRFDVPVLLAVTLTLVLMLLNERVVRWEGAVLLAGLGVYTLWTLWAARREADPVQQEFSVGVPPRRRSAVGDVVRIVGGLLLLVLGARLLVSGAVEIAAVLGVSEAVVALALVAVGTSLPELATSVVAALKDEGDIAVGNLVGSNLFNILGITGVAALVRPLTDTGMQWTDLGMLMLMALLLLPLMRTGFRVNRGEGVLLLALYAAYLGHLVMR